MTTFVMADKVFAVGDDWPPIPFIVKDENGNVIDITGWTFSFLLSQNIDFSEPLFVQTTGIVITNGPGGTGTITVPSASTSLIVVPSGTQNSTPCYVQIHRIDVGFVRQLGAGLIPVRP